MSCHKESSSLWPTEGFVFDIGTVKFVPSNRVHVKQEIKYRNTGDKPFRILSIASNCGCSTAGWDSTQEVLPGGEAAFTATVTINSGADFARPFYVYTDERGRETEPYVFTLKGAVHTELSWRPMRLRLRVPRDETRTARVYLYSSYPGFAISEVTTDLPNAEARIVPSEQPEQFIVDLLLRHNSAESLLKGSVKIQTNYEVQPEISIPATIIY
jgi:hypothetical protein